MAKTTFSAASDYHEAPVNPKQKDTLFRMIFHEKFLTKYRNEAIRMSIFEYDVERKLKLIRQDEFSAGLSRGQ